MEADKAEKSRVSSRRDQANNNEVDCIVSSLSSPPLMGMVGQCWWCLCRMPVSQLASCRGNEYLWAIDTIEYNIMECFVVVGWVG